MIGELDGEGGGAEAGEEDWWTPSVAAAMAEVMPVDDPFYKTDFDLTAHVNALFPTEQSLSRMDETIVRVKSEMGVLEREMGTLVEEGAGAGEQGAEALAHARHAIQELFTRIREIKAKTDLSESMVNEMTRDIKQLDVAKKNLTASITTLNHLHMLLSGLAALQGLITGKRYAEIANLLPGLLKVLEHFHPYLTIPQIAELAGEVHKLRDQIKTQVAEDLKDSLTGAKGLVGASEVLEICRVVSVVDGGELRGELCGWYIDTHMAEYLLLFDDSQDDAWLDKMDHRYSWFRKRLVEFEEKSGCLFPGEWEMGRRLTREFCGRTRKMLESLLGKRKAEVDVKLLLHAIQRTKAFESLLCKRFPPKPRPLPPPASSPGLSPRESDKAKDKEEKSAPITNEFDGCISLVFEGYLSIYVDAQDANLAQFLDQCVRRLKEDGGVPKRTDTSVAQPLPSSGDLFLFFKRTILQLNDITAKPDLILPSVCRLFKKYLRQYADKCLTGALPRVGGSVSYGTTQGLIQSLLREGEVARLSADETFLVACVLVTAEFCSDTTEQLQTKLAARLVAQPQLSDLGPEQEAFHAVTTAALTILLQDMEGACEAPLSTMTKMNWSSLEAVGDESPYVASIKTHLLKTLPPIRDYLSNARRYFLNLCSKFSLSLANKFTGYVMRLRSLSRVAAEQLLLDAQALKSFLLLLPTLDSLAAPKPPSVYTNPLKKAMHKIESIIKIVTLEGGAETVVSHYIKMLPEFSPAEFQRVLELKGVRRGEQGAYVELYRSRAGGGVSSVDVTPSLNSLATPLLQLAGHTADSNIKKLEKLIKIPR